jgi:cytochrome c oxidase cbb3-type subunit III
MKNVSRGRVRNSPLTVWLICVCLGAFSYAQTPQKPPQKPPPPQTPPTQTPPPQGGRQGGAGRGAEPPAEVQEGPGSPAAQRPPTTVNPQTYPASQVEAGREMFSAQCGFCHGRDAMGGETGPDLTRSQLVAEDLRGDKIGPVVRNGRVDKNMPAFNLSDSDLAAVVAFIHDQKAKSESLEGNRRTVDVADLQTGDAKAGEQYFNGPGGCSACHSPAGDLAGLATRHEGLALLRRMLNPPRGRGAGPRAAPTVTVTLPTGAAITGKLVHRDEFTIAMTDASGWYKSWPTGQVKVRVDDPLAAHVDLLDKYTDDDMHNILAYLQTLR